MFRNKTVNQCFKTFAHSASLEALNVYYGVMFEKKKMSSTEEMRYELEFLQQRNEVLQEMLSECEKRLSKENNILEELQNDVFENKRQFCEDVREFVDECGLPTMMSQIEQGSAHSHMKKKYEQLKVELKQVEEELAATVSRCEGVKLQHKTALEEQKKANCKTQEINRKLGSLEEIKHHTELLEAECKSVQQELSQQDQIVTSTEQADEVSTPAVATPLHSDSPQLTGKSTSRFPSNLGLSKLSADYFITEESE